MTNGLQVLAQYESGLISSSNFERFLEKIKQTSGFKNVSFEETIEYLENCHGVQEPRFLLWITALESHFKVSHKNIPNHILISSIQTLHEYGCYSLSRVFCEKLISQSKEIKDKELIDRGKIFLARSLRGSNSISDAVSIYTKLAKKFRDAGDIAKFAYARMLLAKTLDNYEWRVGLEVIVVQDCIKHFKRLLLEERYDYVVEKNLAIALDTLCSIAAEMDRLPQYSDVFNMSNDHIVNEWNKASEIAADAGSKKDNESY